MLHNPGTRVFENGVPVTTTTEQAKKDHVKDCKAPLKYVHPEVIEGCAYGMLAGELKYGSWNFLKGHDIQDLLDATIRHLNSARMGDLIDYDTTQRLRDKYGDRAPDVKHLWLALCNLNMILWQQNFGVIRDSGPLSAEFKHAVD